MIGMNHIKLIQVKPREVIGSFKYINFCEIIVSGVEKLTNKSLDNWKN